MRLLGPAVRIVVHLVLLEVVRVLRLLVQVEVGHPEQKGGRNASQALA